MTCWEVLGITKTQDKNKVFQALVKKVNEADFENDLEYVFRCKKAYDSAIALVAAMEPEKTAHYPWGSSQDTGEHIIPYLDEEEIYQTPEQLISRFTFIYDNLATRYNLLYWKSAIANAKLHTTVSLQEYCFPIIDFLASHRFLKTDVLTEFRKSFPLASLFSTEEWKAAEKENEMYPYIKFLVARGNIELDLHIDDLLTYNFTSDQLEAILIRLAVSLNFARQNDLPRAYNVLIENIPDEAKPLLVKQRELNILFRLALIEEQEETKSYFTDALDQALKRFPGDEHLVFLRASYLFRTASAEEARKALIEILRVSPANDKCFFLLGKCYLKLDLLNEADIIFRNLISRAPLNVEYWAQSAVATQRLLKEQSQNDSLNKDKAYYINRITQLVDLNLYEEINELSPDFPADPDIKALQLYAAACEKYYFEGLREIALLDEAVDYARSPDIILRIVRKQLEFHPNFGDVARIKDYIFKHLALFPDDDQLNFKAGSYYLLLEDYAKAWKHYNKAHEANPHNLDVYLGLARAAEYLEDYQLAKENILHYQHAHNYDPVGYEILTRCSYNMQDYYTCVRSSWWLMSIKDPKNVSTEDQFFLVNALYNFVRNFPTDLENCPGLLLDIQEVILLFDSLPKETEFLQHPRAALLISGLPNYVAMSTCTRRGFNSLIVPLKFLFKKELKIWKI